MAHLKPLKHSDPNRFQSSVTRPAGNAVGTDALRMVPDIE